jgi:hypothetical protein
VLGFGDRVVALIAEQLSRFIADQPLANVVTGEY